MKPLANLTSFFYSFKGKGKAYICLHPFDSRLPPVDVNDKETMEKLRNQYIFTQAFNGLAVSVNTSFPDEVKRMLWRFLTGRQRLQVFHYPNVDKNTLTTTAKKTSIHPTGNSALVTDLRSLSSSDFFDI